VTADKTSAAADETVSLTIAAAQGYELETITVVKSDETTITVTLSGSGNSRTFTMPGYNVTVNATFIRNDEEKAPEDAQRLIENGTYIVAQATANTESEVKKWLAAEINKLPGMSETGITVTVYNISLTGFDPATAGTVSDTDGRNGSFTFTVSLGLNLVTEEKAGTITATPYLAPDMYLIAIAIMSNGDLISDKEIAAADETVTLTVSPVQGYELEKISVVKTDEPTVTVTINNNGNSRTFTMPGYNVTVKATFTKIAAELPEDAKILIENGTYIVPQSTANTENEVKEWLAAEINKLQGMSETGITVVAGDIALSNFTRATTGTSGDEDGINGSFTFTVSLGQDVTTTAQNGTISATPYLAPGTYLITIATLSGGDVISDKTAAAADETVTLTVSPAKGYELEILSVTNMDETIILTYEGSGNSRTFTMPAYDVLVKATFVKTEHNPALTDLQASEGTLFPEFLPEITSYALSLPCGETSVAFSATAFGTGTVIFGNGTGLITFDGSGTQTLSIIAVAEDGETQREYLVIVIGSYSTALIHPYWDDVLAVDLNKENNGGYTFTSFQWTREGNPIQGEINPYLNLENQPAGQYSVILTSDGQAVDVCEVVNFTGTRSLKVYPNPISEKATVENPLWRTVQKMQLYNLAGQLVKEYPVGGSITTISVIDIPTGVYVLKAGKETAKIIKN
jgi:hypothetical protein